MQSAKIKMTNQNLKLANAKIDFDFYPFYILHCHFAF